MVLYSRFILFLKQVSHYFRVLQCCHFKWPYFPFDLFCVDLLSIFFQSVVEKFYVFIAFGMYLWYVFVYLYANARSFVGGMAASVLKLIFG